MPSEAEQAQAQLNKAYEQINSQAYERQFAGSQGVFQKQINLSQLQESQRRLNEYNRSVQEELDRQAQEQANRDAEIAAQQQKINDYNRAKDLYESGKPISGLKGNQLKYYQQLKQNQAAAIEDAIKKEKLRIQTALNNNAEQSFVLPKDIEKTIDENLRKYYNSDVALTPEQKESLLNDSYKNINAEIQKNPQLKKIMANAPPLGFSVLPTLPFNKQSAAEYLKTAPGNPPSLKGADYVAQQIRAGTIDVLKGVGSTVVGYGKTAYGLTEAQKNLLFPAANKIGPESLKKNAIPIPSPSDKDVQSALISTGALAAGGAGWAGQAVLSGALVGETVTSATIKPEPIRSTTAVLLPVVVAGGVIGAKSILTKPRLLFAEPKPQTQRVYTATTTLKGNAPVTQIKGYDITQPQTGVVQSYWDKFLGRAPQEVILQPGRVEIIRATGKIEEPAFSSMAATQRKSPAATLWKYSQSQGTQSVIKFEDLSELPPSERFVAKSLISKKPFVVKEGTQYFISTAQTDAGISIMETPMGDVKLLGLSDKSIRISYPAGRPATAPEVIKTLDLTRVYPLASDKSASFFGAESSSKFTTSELPVGRGNILRSVGVIKLVEGAGTEKVGTLFFGGKGSLTRLSQAQQTALAADTAKIITSVKPSSTFNAPAVKESSSFSGLLSSLGLATSIYAGTGQYERTREGQLPMTMQPQKTSQNTREGERTIMNIQPPIFTETTKVTPSGSSGSRDSEIFGSPQGQVPQTIPKQETPQWTIPKIPLMQIPKVSGKIPPPEEGGTIGMSGSRFFNEPVLKSALGKLSKGYKTFVFRSGKKVYLSGIRPRKEAIKTGENIVLSGSEATFGIEVTKQPVLDIGEKYTPSSKLFRTFKYKGKRRVELKDEWIQKTAPEKGHAKGRLAAKSEVLSVLSAKKRRRLPSIWR